MAEALSKSAEIIVLANVNADSPKVDRICLPGFASGYTVYRVWNYNLFYPFYILRIFSVTNQISYIFNMSFFYMART